MTQALSLGWVGPSEDKKLSSPGLLLAQHGGRSHLCVRMRACVRALACLRECAPARTCPLRARRTGLPRKRSHSRAGLTTQRFLGFAAYAPRSGRSLFVLASDRWRAFYTGRLNEGPGDFYGC